MWIINEITIERIAYKHLMEKKSMIKLIEVRKRWTVYLQRRRSVKL